MEVQPIDLSMSEQMKCYLALIEWHKAKLDEFMLSMCMTQDQLGKPQRNTTSAKVAIYNTEIPHCPGIDGQHFKIPFDKPFQKNDMITVAAWNGAPLLIVDEPVHTTITIKDEKIYYWLHTVVMYENKTGYFHPPKYLTKDIIYTKII